MSENETEKETRDGDRNDRERDCPTDQRDPKHFKTETRPRVRLTISLYTVSCLKAKPASAAPEHILLHPHLYSTLPMRPLCTPVNVVFLGSTPVTSALASTRPNNHERIFSQ